MTPRWKFLRTEDGLNWYRLRCACGDEGEVGFLVNRRATFGCPENCGTVWLQSDPGKTPALRCVVRPYFPIDVGLTNDGDF